MANEFKVRKGLIVQGSGSAILDIFGSQGQLFSVTDSLSGSLFSVNDISGIPIMEVFSDNTIKLGTYNQEAIIVSGSRTGMGTALPQAELHISGANNDSLFRIQSPASSSIIFVSGSGNVGIGTLTPTQKVSVDNGNVGFTSGFGLSWDSNTEWIRRAAASDQLQFATQDTVRLNIGSTQGQLVTIGLGATIGSAQFQVRGGGATSATTAMRIENSGGTARLTILDDGTSAFNTSHLYVSSSGNVGIGTATPTLAKLQISTVGNGSASLDAAGSSFNGVHAVLPGRIYVGAAATGYPQIMYNAIPSQSAAWRYAGNDTAWAIDMGGNNQMRFRYAGVGTAGNDLTWTDIMVLASGSGNVGIGTSSPTNRLQVVGGVTATSFTGSLLGTASLAVNALTASFVNTLNQNVVITGSAAIGTSSLGPSENTLTLGARDSVNEGGQLGLNAPGGTYTSASFIDNYQNQFRILRGSNNGSNASVAGWNLHSLQMSLPAYTNASSFPGTATANLAVDSSGNVITVSTAGGSVFPYVGNAVITGSLTTTGIIYAQPNGGMYFQGGDDAALYDINISNHMGIYGVQDSTVASIKLGSGGGIISGRDNRIGIGITSPSASLHISGASADRLLQVGSPTLANILFVTGSGNVGIGIGTPAFRLDVSGSAKFGTGSVGFASGLGQVHAVDRTGAYISATQTSSSIVTFMGADGNGGIIGTYSNHNLLIRTNNSNKITVEPNNIGIQTAPSEWIHLSSDPASSKYIRIDATQFSASPTEQGGSPDTAIGQSVNTNKYLTEPDYWIEIKLGAAGGIVLIPCYIKG